MNRQIDTGTLSEHQAGIDVGRRNLLKLTGVGVAALSMMSVAAPAFAQSTLAWDKTFPKRGRVDHRKVSFYRDELTSFFATSLAVSEGTAGTR